jgi:methylthioribulose-1-phosphate dehydratase
MTEAATEPEVFAESLVEVARWISTRGSSPATSGNYSLRTGSSTCAITMSGRDKGRLEPSDLVIIELSGRPVTAGRPSAETLLHIGLYNRSASIGAVLHTHSRSATVLSMAVPVTEIVLQGYELLKVFGFATHEARLVVPIFDNDQDIGRLQRTVDDHLSQHPLRPCFGYLIRAHGLYTWGADLAEACRYLEALEYLFECELDVRKLRARAGTAD